jgi:hypothetical protein
MTRAPEPILDRCRGLGAFHEPRVIKDAPPTGRSIFPSRATYFYKHGRGSRIIFERGGVHKTKRAHHASHVEITQCQNADGCCPSGCNISTDGDCRIVCGDGIVSQGETCDPPGSCPANCDDGDGCTEDFHAATTHVQHRLLSYALLPMRGSRRLLSPGLQQLDGQRLPALMRRQKARRPRRTAATRAALC